MREGNNSKLPQRNPITHAVHRREVFWQVTVPLVIGTLIILSLATGVWFVSYNSASQAADISLIWLILPALIFTLIFTFLLGGLTFGLIKLISILPPYAALVQNYFVLFNLKVTRAVNVAVEPVLKAASALAWLKALLGKKPSGRD
jgi:hypothetical protein